MCQEDITKREKTLEAAKRLEKDVSPYVSGIVAEAKMEMTFRRYRADSLKLVTVTGLIVLGHDSVCEATVSIWNSFRLGIVDRIKLQRGQEIRGEIFSFNLKEPDVSGLAVHVYAF